MMPHQVIIKVVGNSCNLRCSYCFYNGLDQSEKTVLPLSTLEKFMGDFLGRHTKKKIQFIWHGGEPLLAGLDFFRQAIKLQKNYPEYRFCNALQTNGTLINKKWIDFFKENDFGIGISFDGTKDSHDAHRKYATNRGTFDKIRTNIKLCQKNGIKTGLIQTITKDNIPNLNEDLRYIYNNIGQMKWGINFYHSSSTINHHDSFSINNRELEKIYKTLIEFWLSMDDEDLSLGEIDDLLAGVLNKRPSGCAYNGTCGKNYFCLNFDGNIYLCDRTSNKPNNSWGNINKDNLEIILSGDKKNQQTELINSLPKDCMDCKWVKSCNNGCSALRDSNNKYIYCHARKSSFESLTHLVNNHMEKKT